jgi:spore coat protein U-like protein
MLVMLANMPLHAARALSGPNISCSVATTPLAFGEYLPYRAVPTESTSEITVTCTTSGSVEEPWSGVIFLVGSRLAIDRQMQQGPDALRYQLYLDPARTIVWGDNDAMANSLPISGTVSPSVPFRQTIVIYGLIPAMQTSSPVAQYDDQISATLSY